MLGVVGLSKVQRFLLGIFLLLLVDFLRVISSEVTEYIFGDEGFEKPFFTTYLKTTMFMLYLLGFLMWRPWRQQCRKSPLDVAMKAEDIDSGGETECYLTEAIYVPLKVEKTSGTESEDCTGEDSRSVRFSNLSEVRQLPDKFAEDALIARLSYTASLRAEQARFRSLSKLSVKEVAKLSFIFCILWFFANLAYQEALHDSEAGIVNVLSSTSGFFTLVLAAMYPACNADRFSLSKLVAVLISIAGVVLVSLSDMPLTADLDIPVGALWALLGAILYAFYLVVLRRKVDHEDKIDIPMFFGFVGLFNAVLIWPGFLILHYTRSEVFQWPNRQQWAYICVNGVVGMVVSELLWVWGCFLTSSLVATLGLSLTVPINMAADIVVKKVAHSWMFYVGCVPIFFSFFAVGFLSHYDGWDPVLLALKKLLHCVCRMKSASRIHVRDLDREQSESLIGVQTSDSPGHPT